MSPKISKLALLTTLVSTISFAQDTTMQISSKVNSSCSISMSDVSFGDLTNITGNLSIPNPLNVLCNKNSHVKLEAIGSTNPQGNTGKYLTINNTIVSQNGGGAKVPGSGIKYHMVAVDDVNNTNESYRITHKGSSIIKDWGGNSNFSLGFNVLQGNPFELPIIFFLPFSDYDSQKYLYKSGNYSDTVTLTLSY